VPISYIPTDHIHKVIGVNNIHIMVHPTNKGTGGEDNTTPSSKAKRDRKSESKSALESGGKDGKRKKKMSTTPQERKSEKKRKGSKPTQPNLSTPPLQSGNTPTTLEFSSPMSTASVPNNIDVLNAQFMDYTDTNTVNMKPAMIMFTALLYINEADELVVGNGNVNHNYWDPQTGLEITIISGRQTAVMSSGWGWRRGPPGALDTS
jgi:hypothetical protein